MNPVPLSPSPPPPHPCILTSRVSSLQQRHHCASVPPSLPSSPQVSLFFSESPTNPYLRCIDIARVSALCRSHGATVCIDGTFATPVNQQAIALGADLVLNSATKYFAGHHDVSG